MNISTLSFLKKLEQNNNREWFNEHKKLFTVAGEDVASFVEELIREIAKFDKEIGKVDAKKSLFRIYRATRFSHNKDPYKINFGANISLKMQVTISISSLNNPFWQVVSICSKMIS